MKKLFLILLLGISITSLQAVAEKSKSWTPTHQQRLEMAKVHEQMAACLRSDKPISECRNEMMSSCHKTMGKGHCPMMQEMNEHMH